jgi:predicted metal-dependent phosphoesterase TrpH
MGEGYNISEFKIDLHIHTIYSGDSKCNPKEIIHIAKERGLDGIGITDHNTVEGLKAFEKTLSDFIIIPGIEISTAEGHIIGLGVNQEITKGKPAVQTIQEIYDLGGIAIIPHPYDYLRNGVGRSINRLNFSAVEVINAGQLLPLSNYFARRAANNNNWTMVAGSDAHLPELIGYAYTIIESDDLSVNEVLEGIHKGNCTPSGRISSLWDKIKTFVKVRM